MGTFSIWHWIILLAIALLLFGGGGKIPKLMRDMGEGITAFRKGLKKDEKQEGAESTAPAGQGATLQPPSAPPSAQPGAPGAPAQGASQGTAQGPAKT